MPLQNDGTGMDVNMDMGTDGSAWDAFACNACGKGVCATCAVVGDVRYCLGCACKGSGMGMGMRM